MMPSCDCDRRFTDFRCSATASTIKDTLLFVENVILESGACPLKILREKLHSAVQRPWAHEGSTHEYTALIEPDMSRITLIIGSIIFTPDTDDGFGGFPSPPETSARKPYAQFWEFSTSTEDSWLAMRLTCTLCAFARKPLRSLDFERQSAQNRSNRTKSAIVCSAPSISNSLGLAVASRNCSGGCRSYGHGV